MAHHEPRLGGRTLDRRDCAPLAVPRRGDPRSQLSLVVRIEGAAGGEIENAFLILLLRQGDERWRVLTRLRVPVEDDGRPRPRVESVTVQRVGFSGEL
jgi:hypothetical protein